MIAYANPEDRTQETLRADGYGLVRFRKSERLIEFECWHRFTDVTAEGAQKFPGWPVTIRSQDNDGREVVGHLPELKFTNSESPVVQVISEGAPTKRICTAVRRLDWS